MNNWTEIIETVTPYVLPVFNAGAILIVGYFLCKVIAWVVKKLLDRTTI